MDKESFKQYALSFGIAIQIFLFFSIYLLLRRDYFDLYIANKIFAGVGFILLALVLSLGTLSREYQVFDQFLQYRKELGITAFFFVVLHSFVSFFMLPEHFPLEHFQSGIIVFFFGLLGTSMATILFGVSLERIKRIIAPKEWWRIQYWGVRIAGAAVLLHVLPMKYSGWMKWYAGVVPNGLYRPNMPPAGLLVASFGVYVLFIRLSEIVFKQKAAWIIPLLGYAYVVFLGLTFGWGLGR